MAVLEIFNRQLLLFLFCFVLFCLLMLFVIVIVRLLHGRTFTSISMANSNIPGTGINISSVACCSKSLVAALRNNDRPVDCKRGPCLGSPTIQSNVGFGLHQGDQLRMREQLRPIHRGRRSLDE
jgi:hypothetical protein